MSTAPADATAVGPLEAHLRARRDAGAKLLVPYLTGGYRADWARAVEAFGAAGADAIEVGIPFSDPVMDGPTIQEASAAALADGATPSTVLDTLGSIDPGVPLVTMSYYNTAFRMGHRRFARDLDRACVARAIVTDLP